MSAETPPPGWEVVDGALEAMFATKDFATGLRFVNDIGAAAEEADHHPDIDLRYATVRVRTWSHDKDAITDRDHRLAARISALADQLGVGDPPNRDA